MFFVKKIKRRCLVLFLFLWMNQIHFVFNLLWFSWMSSVLFFLFPRRRCVVIVSLRSIKPVRLFFTNLHTSRVCLHSCCGFAFLRLKFHSQKSIFAFVDQIKRQISMNDRSFKLLRGRRGAFNFFGQSF